MSRNEYISGINKCYKTCVHSLATLHHADLFVYLFFLLHSCTEQNTDLNFT